MTQQIWTLNARDSVFLEVMSSYLNLSDEQVRSEILRSHAETQEILSAKGVEYSSLRTALVPQTDKFEYAFIFDLRQAGPGGYRSYVAIRNAVVSALDRNQSCSILHGDLIGDDQRTIFDLLQQNLHLRRSARIQHTAQLYCVYINNLSRKMCDTIDGKLSLCNSYIGYIDATFSSKMKDYLSVTIGPIYLKSKGTVICGHYDDTPNEENMNLPSWPFEESGYRCISLQATTYFDLYLHYKIERAIYRGFESDTLFALSAIAALPRDLSDFTVVVSKGKADYLASEKSGSLKKAGIQDMTPAELGELIRSKIGLNYIYHLRYRADHNASLFNILLEVENPSHLTPTRLMCSMRYQAEERELHLVTMH